MNRNYFSMTKTGQTATINIYGDITSIPWFEGDVSSAKLSKQLEELKDVTEITVFINSYGGEVAEGLAIYNSLKRHKAKVTTICDGFAASIASVIFMAGDERIMNDSSLLMIHNAWTCCSGNAQELRKQADDLEKITSASVVAYKAHSSLSEEEIKELMDNESWITPEEALKYGFATSIEKTEAKAANQSVKKRLFELIKFYSNALPLEAEDEETGDEEPDVDAPGNGEEEPETADDAEDEEAPDDEEPPADDDPADEEDESEDEENPEEAAQRWSGFFNALMKM